MADFSREVWLLIFEYTEQEEYDPGSLQDISGEQRDTAAADKHHPPSGEPLKPGSRKDKAERARVRPQVVEQRAHRLATSYALISRNASAAANQFLYAHIDFKLDVHDLLALLRTLSTRPDLAALVKTTVLDLIQRGTGNLVDGYGDDVVSAYILTASRILERCPNLRTLHLVFNVVGFKSIADEFTPILEKIFKETLPIASTPLAFLPRLRTLVVRSVSATDLDVDLIGECLRFTPALEDLVLINCCLSDHDGLRPSNPHGLIDLPCLRRLCVAYDSDFPEVPVASMPAGWFRCTGLEELRVHRACNFSYKEEWAQLLHNWQDALATMGCARSVRYLTAGLIGLDQLDSDHSYNSRKARSPVSHFPESVQDWHPLSGQLEAGRASSWLRLQESFPNLLMIENQWTYVPTFTADEVRHLAEWTVPRLDGCTTWVVGWGEGCTNRKLMSLITHIPKRLQGLQYLGASGNPPHMALHTNASGQPELGAAQSIGADVDPESANTNNTEGGDSSTADEDMTLDDLRTHAASSAGVYPFFVYPPLGTLGFVDNEPWAHQRLPDRLPTLKDRVTMSLAAQKATRS